MNRGTIEFRDDTAGFTVNFEKRFEIRSRRRTARIETALNQYWNIGEAYLFL